MKLDQQLDQLSRKLRQLDQSEQTDHLTPAKLAILRLVQQHNPVTLKELAQKQQVALPTASKIVDDLQKRALVIRALSKEDARQRWIVPTQKGLVLLKQSESQNEAFWQNKLSQLSTKQLKQLSQSLDLLLTAI
ncbi:MAG: MarR family transcriptional regulator [Enterobacterales bacterium]|nr:MarR family transcriptional regulator [Enterobacterales bacterium]